MGRSKRNYDHLVDKQGNYGIDVIRGIFPGSDGNNLKGDKGVVGDKGEPGVQGPKGALGATGRAGVDGQKGEKGAEGLAGPPLEFDQLTAGQRDLIKGQRGEKGDKGEIHTAPMLNFVGNAANLITLPAPANDFDTVYVESEDRYYTYYNGNWAVAGSPVKGEKGDIGEKGAPGVAGTNGAAGATGPQGPPGLDGSMGLQGEDGKSAYEVAYDLDNTIGSEQDWIDSLKGEQGAPGVSAGGDPFDNANYYDKSAIDQLIAGHEVPQRAFNYYFHGEYPDNHFTSGTVNFLSTDRFDRLYDSGCIKVDLGTTIVPNAGRPPFAVSTKFLIINYVLNDPMGSRSELYNLLQFAYSLTNDGEFEGFVRRVAPHQNQFGEWQVCAFDPNIYYTRTQVDSLFRTVQTPKEYIIRPDAILGAPNSAKVTLSGRNASGPDDTSVILQGENGISVYRDGDSIVIDGDRLNGIEYVGPISPSDDPYVKRPTAEIGDFYIYSRAGTAWNGATVNTGDWVIFGPPVTSGSGTNEWSIIFVGAPQGVMSVEANEPLEVTGTDQNPIVYLDPDLYFKNENLADTLKPYAQWRDLFDVSRLRTLSSLLDVEVGEGNMGPGGIYNNQLSAIPATPMTAGSYYLDPAGGRLVFAQNDATVTPFLEAYNGTIPEDSIIRVISNDLSFHVESKVLTKDFDGLNYSYTFENPLLIQTLAFNPGSSFTMRLAFGYDTPDGSFLKWEESLKKWIPSEHDYITDTEATEKFLLRRTGSSLLRADLIQMQDYNGGDTRIWLSGEVDVRGDKGELSCKKLSVSGGAYVGSAVDPFLATLPNAVVTKARMDQAFDEYEALFVDHPAFQGQFDQVQLKDLLVFNDNVPVAEFRATGRDRKSFDFTVGSSTDPSGLKKILSINENRANFMGATLTNIDNPQGPRDAVPLEFIDERFLRTDLRDQYQTCRSQVLELYQDTFEVRASDGTRRFVVDGGGIELGNPKSTRLVDDLYNIGSQELMGSWYIDRQVSQLETLLTEQINKKTEEAPKNGNQYARKDGQWVKVEATGGGGGGTGDVEEAPFAGGPYVRQGGQWKPQPASTVDAGSTLPANPVRGSLYLTSGNVLAIGL